MLAAGLGVFAVGALAAVQAGRANTGSSRKLVTWGWYGVAGCESSPASCLPRSRPLTVSATAPSSQSQQGTATARCRS